MGGPQLFEQIDLAVLAHDIDQTDAILVADPGQHLAKVGCSDRMQDRILPVHPGILDEPQSRHGIDEGARPILGGMIAQRQAHRGIGNAVLAVGIARHAGDALSDKRLGSVIVARCDHRAGAFVAGRQLEAMPRFRARVEGLGHGRDEFAGRVAGIFYIGRTDQDGEVRRVDRRRLHFHEHLVASRIGETHVLDRHGERAIRVQLREQLLTSGGHFELSKFRCCDARLSSVRRSEALTSWPLSLLGWQIELPVAETNRKCSPARSGENRHAEPQNVLTIRGRRYA